MNDTTYVPKIYIFTPLSFLRYKKWREPPPCDWWWQMAPFHPSAAHLIFLDGWCFFVAIILRYTLSAKGCVCQWLKQQPAKNPGQMWKQTVSFSFRVFRKAWMIVTSFKPPRHPEITRSIWAPALVKLNSWTKWWMHPSTQVFFNTSRYIIDFNFMPHRMFFFLKNLVLSFLGQMWNHQIWTNKKTRKKSVLWPKALMSLGDGNMAIFRGSSLVKLWSFSMMFSLVVGKKKHEKNTPGKRWWGKKKVRNAFCLNLDGKYWANTLFFGWLIRQTHFYKRFFVWREG